MVSHLTAMHEHGMWADRRLLGLLQATANAAALRECAHIRGAQETWLSRIEQRTPALPVWPELSVAGLATHGDAIDAGWSSFLTALREADLDTTVTYRNSAGDTFTTPLRDILLHVMLHGQYHRGKAIAAIRGAGTELHGVDYILWQRELAR
jgi:uncharacterized damage-inducible protein DinB